jgi:hypothetical protein
MTASPSSIPLRAELHDAMDTWGCPLCRLKSRAEAMYVTSLSYERVLDLTTRDLLKASRGLCASHTRDWQRVQGAALGVAIVYRVSILDLLRDTEPGRAASGGMLSRKRNEARVLGERLTPEARCPACEVGEGAAERFGQVLLQELASGETCARFVACGGLCLPHLRMLLLLPKAGQGYEALVEAQRTAWRGLMGELDEFIRKNDYRFAGETMTEAEATSWTRALDAVVGLEED